MEGAPVDPMVEWGAPGGETGLEEPMWQLGLGVEPESYPERPGEPDCGYYLKTGFCGYGARCRFNHPRDRSVVMRALMASGGDYPERVGQPVCQYYMRTGMCKYGASCKYHHPKQEGGSSGSVTLNYYGYPLRPGDKDCSYYSKYGRCKFGITCKFNHPQPPGLQMPVPAPGPGALPIQAAVPTPPVYPTSSVQPSQQYGVVPGNWPVPRPAVFPPSYPMLLPPGIVPGPGWTPYPASVSPVASSNPLPTVGMGPLYGITQLSPSVTAYTGVTGPYLSITSAGPSGSSQQEHAFPERPGQPECQSYLRTGACKYGPTCKYHHPPEWIAPTTNYMLSPLGLPLRPGAPVCISYSQNAVCQFGPLCRFDHPMKKLSSSPSASSLTDMPVAPYPVGSSIATLAPSSSSSSDLRPEVIAGYRGDSPSPQMSSISSTGASVGSIYSQSGPVSHSSIQQSGQGIGGEVHTSN
ncbi:zinc finger CCCH domain-containing 34 [Olea europaea subsp. europaea]|uniref:Zinc finger CCCH domain-containing 34 n=3 Tax=Olea europaea subsp. europaea TaxID=158383 RepID=A0A8S0RVT1_OLEEU|nr:zinc finger CCCH domain-containing 34 [Olea europaea subsp. europaea]